MSDILKFKNLVLVNREKDKVYELAKNRNETLTTGTKNILKKNYSLFSLCFLQRDNNKEAYHEPLFFLDKEDIEYLSKKYFSRLDKEMQAKIDAIKAEYKEDIE